MLVQGSKRAELIQKCDVSRMHATDWPVNGVTRRVMRATLSGKLKSSIFEMTAQKPTPWVWQTATDRAAPSHQCPALLRCVHVVDKWCHRTSDPDAHQAVLSWVGAVGKEAIELILWGLIISPSNCQTYSGAINHGDEESWNFTGIHQTVAEIFQSEPKQCCPVLIHTHTCTHTLRRAASDCSRQTDWWVTSEPEVVSLCKQLERLGRAGWFSQPDTLEIHTGSIQ